MLISTAWIHELLDTTAPPDAATLSATLTSLGLEVEGQQEVGADVRAVIVGEVRGLAPHPNADRLRVVTLFDGTQERTVVCGAPNVPEPGGRVAFAPVGAVLPGDFAIGAREVRGVHSEGMICSEAELDIGPDGDGIIVLPGDFTPGTPLHELVPTIIDTVIEISVTPNRPDALGHVGVARDVAAKLGLALRLPAPELPETQQAAMASNTAPERCGRYYAVALEGAEVGPSPLWLKTRLHRVGLRAINNVVDITNLVLMEWGQPLHAFDRDRLAGGGVQVRLATADEPMTCLDGTELKLTTEDLVIADHERPVALAGVMGGADSGVEPGATRLLLEAAYFAPLPVRATARRHGMASDSSFRFERGVDYGVGLERARNRAAALLVELAGARVVARDEAPGERPAVPSIGLRAERVERLLGIAVPADRIAKHLEALGIGCEAPGEGRWTCTPPTHRPDLNREEDLIEEVLRLEGLDALPNVASVPSTAVRPNTVGVEERPAWRITDALAACGCAEVVSLAFAGDEVLEPVVGPDLSRAVELTNPMRAQDGKLRMHLLPGLLSSWKHNLARHGQGVRLFEVGRVYRWGERPLEHHASTAAIDGQLPEEHTRAAVLWGPGTEVRGGAQDVGAALLAALRSLALHAEVRPVAEGRAVAWLHPGVQAEVWAGQGDDAVCVGRFGEVHPDLVERWDVAPAYYGQLELEAVPGAAVARFRAIERHPATARDLSLEVPVRLPVAEVCAALESAASEIPSEEGPSQGQGVSMRGGVSVLEDYRGEGIPDGHRALLLRAHYGAAERTVTDDEAQALHERVVSHTIARLEARASELGGVLRRR